MITLNETKLKALLEKRRKNIEKVAIPFDGFFAVVTFLFSLLMAGKDSTVHPIVLAVFWVFFLLYAVWVIYRCISSIFKKYTIENLYQDIMNTEERKREFILISVRCVSQHPNSFLLQYDVRWKCYLLPYCKVDLNLPEPIEEQVARYLSSCLGIDIQKDKVRFLFDAEHTKYSVSDKVDKTYQHHFYGIELDEHADVKRKHFKRNGSKFRWFTIPQMDRNRGMKKKNGETINDLRDHFQSITTA